MSEPWLSDAASAADRETIALLQEEIARLEDELLLHDQAASAERQALRPDPRQAVHAEQSAGQIVTLRDELACREETIALLLEQIRLADEAEAASRAEWEQLNQWVQEVERRVAEQGDSGTDFRDELEAERRNSELLRQAAEKDQRSSEVQRVALVAEVERLRAKFTQLAGESDATVAAVVALEHENQELREAYDTFARNVVPAHEMDAIVEELQAVRKERDRLAQELQRERDDRKRERNEQEATMNAFRSQLARESLRRQEEHVKTTGGLPESKDPRLEADERIHAFREHLREIHQDEAQERMKRSLAARLSRLWHHTSQNQ